MSYSLSEKDMRVIFSTQIKMVRDEFERRTAARYPKITGRRIPASPDDGPIYTSVRPDFWRNMMAVADLPTVLWHILERRLPPRRFSPVLPVRR